jgi:NhaA family Na+:H+ antiporter
VGIPMATDIAFALGVLSLLGDRVPVSLKIFLVALAIMDDLGAIIVIALFYSGGLSILPLAGVLLIIAVLYACNRMKIQSVLLYLVAGIALWYFIHQSGIHSTITGVILAFLIPFGKGETSSPSHRLQRLLHFPVAFVVLPLFALANTGVAISSGWHLSLKEPNGLGILLGLIYGKPLGITLFSMVAVRLGFCSLPANIQWKHIISVSILGGIGFTMSTFIAILAFQDAAILEQSKIAIFLGSLVSGVLGYLSLMRILKH